MYTLGSLILMAILLGAVMPVFNSLTHTLKLDTIIRRIPIIGAHTALAISILLALCFASIPLAILFKVIQ